MQGSLNVEVVLEGNNTHHNENFCYADDNALNDEVSSEDMRKL